MQSALDCRVGSRLMLLQETHEPRKLVWLHPILARQYAVQLTERCPLRRQFAREIVTEIHYVRNEVGFRGHTVRLANEFLKQRSHSRTYGVDNASPSAKPLWCLYISCRRTVCVLHPSACCMCQKKKWEKGKKNSKFSIFRRVVVQDVPKFSVKLSPKKTPVLA